MAWIIRTRPNSKSVGREQADAGYLNNVSKIDGESLRAEYAPQFGPREEARQFPSKDDAQRFLSQYGLKGFDIVSLLDPKA